MERTPINPYYYVICTNLECDATVGRFQPTEEEAIAAWNRRDGESAATDGHFDFIPEEEQKYCWNCGAIMDGKAISND